MSNNYINTSHLKKVTTYPFAVKFISPALLFSIFSLFFSSCDSTKRNKLPEDEIFKGQIKSLTELRYTGHDNLGKIVEEEFEGKTIIYFDKSGLITKKEYYNTETGVYPTSADNYYYDSIGLLTKMMSSGEECQWLYYYDDANKIIEKNKYGNNGFLKNKHSYQYNNKNQLSQETYFDSDGKLITTQYDYYNSGNLVRQTFSFGSNFAKKEWHHFGYDKKGILIYDTMVADGVEGVEGELEHVSKYNYTFDNVGNVVKKIRLIQFKGFDIQNMYFVQIFNRSIEYYEKPDIISDSLRALQKFDFKYLSFLYTLLWIPSLFLIPKFIGMKRNIGWKWSLFFTISLTWIGGALLTLISQPLNKPRRVKLNKILGTIGIFLLLANIYVMTKNENYNLIGLIQLGGIIMYCLDGSKNVNSIEKIEE